MKRIEQEQRVKMLTECIKNLEEMKETNESVIVIADSFTCTSMIDEEGKTDEEIFKDYLSAALALITNYLVRMAERAQIPLTNILMSVLIEIAKEEGIEVGQFSAEEFPKEALEALEKREQILN